MHETIETKVGAQGKPVIDQDCLRHGIQTGAIVETSEMAKILIVEDDAVVADILRTTLSEKRHVVEHVSDGAVALDCISHYKFDLIILDWHLPVYSGPQIAKQAKERHPSTMILMLT